MSLEKKKKLKSKSACVISITRAGNALAKEIVKRNTAEENIQAYTLKKYNTPELEEFGFLSISDLDDFFREAFKTYDTLIAVMSTGIVVRKIASLLTSKDKDPGIIVTDVLGENFIPLLSGHLGKANENAAILSKTLNGRAIITTASDKLKRLAVDTLAESIGAQLSSLEKAKEVTSLIVDNKRIALIGFKDIDLEKIESLRGYNLDNLVKVSYPPDLFNRDAMYSNVDNVMPTLKEEFSGAIILSDRERLVDFSIPCVQLIPKNIIVGIGFKKEVTAEEIIEQLLKLIKEINISAKSLLTFATIPLKAEQTPLIKAAKILKMTITAIPDEKVKKCEHLFDGSAFVKEQVGLSSVSEPAGYLASNKGDCLLEAVRENGTVISIWRENKEVEVQPRKIYVTGIGPGDKDLMSPRALESLKEADVIVGYKTYIDLIKNLPDLKSKEFLSTGMKSEKERAETVLGLADKGYTVALISSGDPGVYGMAGILLEVAEISKNTYDIEVIPGITSANASAAVLGAPLMHDYCIISLSDLLTPWEVIEKRLRAAGEGDFIITLYNPKSNSRQDQIKRARDILLEYKSPNTPVGIVTRASREGEQVIITNLEMMLESDINMFSTVVIGNSQTYISKDGTKLITPRGYKI